MADRQRLFRRSLTTLSIAYMLFTLCEMNAVLCYTRILLMDDVKYAVLDDMVIPLEITAYLQLFFLATVLSTIVFLLFDMNYELWKMKKLVLCFAIISVILLLALMMISTQFRMEEHMKEYHVSPKSEQIVDKIQRELQCCGYDNYEDWTLDAYKNPYATAEDNELIGKTTKHLWTNTSIQHSNWVYNKDFKVPSSCLKNQINGNTDADMHSMVTSAMKYITGSPMELLNVSGCKGILKVFKLKTEIEVYTICLLVIVIQTLFIYVVNLHLNQV